MEKTSSASRGKSCHLSSHLSFAPVVRYLKEQQSKRTDFFPGYFCDTIDNFFLDPGCDEILKHPATANQHEYLVECMMNLVFACLDPGFEFYTLTQPLTTEIIYSSNQFKKKISSEKSFRYLINKEPDHTQFNTRLAYQLILAEFYGLSFFSSNIFVQQVTDNITGLKKFVEFELVPRFIDVKLKGELPDLDKEYLSKLFGQLKNDPMLQNILPLHLFSFEGIMIVKVRDVTTRETINLIKNILLSMPYFGDQKSMESLQEQVRNLVGSTKALISLSYVVEKNDDMQVDPAQDKFLFRATNFIYRGSPVWLQIKELFEERSFISIQNFSGSLLQQYPFLHSLTEKEIGSLIMFPLKSGKKLLGVFSLLLYDTGAPSQSLLQNIEQVIPLMILAMGKQSEKMDDEIDRVVKEQFTAVQSSVNWKFTKAARNFIIQKSRGQNSKIENIVFENVFPLYGSVDVRNSSIERSSAIQKDLFSQLELADAIIRKSKREIYLFSLQEISHRIEKYLDVASVVLFPGDEMAIQNFLDEEITELFNHLKMAIPSVRDDIENYFLLLNSNTRKISTQCSAFEESIAMINNELVKFINEEQIKIQEIYAHYFEYFVTDGVDFNIYIGQSITPDKPFDQFYLKNLKLWQLTTLVKAAQKIRKLQDDIPVPLDTTQLILAHNKPLSISFRAAERKFDVDGAYNIHYEIIKKRIDKIKIMGSCERLTQPGKIAIVFAHNKEAQEYKSYIEFLQKEGLLEGEIEYYDLEELPGVRGLKALRVSINMNIKEEVCPSIIPEYQIPVASLKLTV